MASDRNDEEPVAQDSLEIQHSKHQAKNRAVVQRCKHHFWAAATYMLAHEINKGSVRI
jgi:hypothetical protein